MTKRKLCRRCEKNPAVVNYCNECMREVSHIRDNQMYLTRATACLINSGRYMPEDEKVGLFLELFHPNMPMTKKAAVRADVRRANGR